MIRKQWKCALEQFATSQLLIAVTPFHPDRYPIHIDTISMEVSILYFKGV